MPPRKRTSGIEDAGEDSLVKLLAETLKKDGVSTFFIGQEDTPTDLKDFVGSGASTLDLAVSNRPNGGIIAYGRLLEMTGLEGSGKSLVAAHMMANVQKEDGVAVLIDTETAVNEQFFTAVGLDMNKLVYVHTNCLEEIFEATEKIIEKVRQSNKNRKVIIVIDSLAGASPRKELDGTYDKDGYATDKAIILSKAMRKITPLIANQKIALVCTNQLRYKMNAMPFSDPWTTSGGKAVAFHSSVRIRFSVAGQIKNKDGVVVGLKIDAKVVKNRFGPPLRSVKFDVYFDRGIDDVASWLDYLKKADIIDGTNGRFTYVDGNGEEHKFMTGNWKQFCEDNPTVFEELYTKLANSMVMTYKTDNLSTVDGSAEVVETSDGVNDRVTLDN